MSLTNYTLGKEPKACKKSGKQARRKILQVLKELVTEGLDDDEVYEEFLETSSDFAKTFDYHNKDQLDELNLMYA